jgi:hypothetical protein
MPRYFLHYWTDAICDDAMDHGGNEAPMDYCAGDERGWEGVAADDVVYAINVLRGELYVIGRMRVASVTSSPSDAWRRLGDKARAGTWHAIGAKGGGTPQYFTRVMPPDQVRLLQVVDPATGSAEPIWRKGIERARLRGLHELDERSAGVLDAFLALPFEDRETEEDDEFVDEEYEEISDGEARDILAQYQDGEQNDRVALTALAAARHELESRGYDYDEAAEGDDAGHDFTVTQGGETRRVVVRGVVDTSPAFMIDDASLLLLEDDRRALLCVVTDVLGSRRAVRVMTGDEFFDDFETRPVLHVARPIE